VDSPSWSWTTTLACSTGCDRCSNGSARGFRTAQTGAAGLRAAALHRPHLYLIDLDMPVMDGFELARRFRQILSWAGLDSSP
jgi:CheY-like chemotaxis protein